MITEEVYYEYSCNSCGYFWRSKEKLNNPTCPKCIDQLRYYWKQDYISNMNENSPCFHCSNHPKNGGSGICHCTLGSENQITY